MKAKRGQPAGGGKWQQLILMALAEAPDPVILLVPDGAPKTLQQALSKAAKSLADQDKIKMFKMRHQGRTGRRLRTFVALPDNPAAAEIIERYSVEKQELEIGVQVYPGSRRYEELKTISDWMPKDRE